MYLSPFSPFQGHFGHCKSLLLGYNKQFRLDSRLIYQRLSTGDSNLIALFVFIFVLSTIFCVSRISLMA